MKLSPSCYAVTGLGYSAPWFVNAGFVVGDEITLVVDTGANAAAAASIYGYAVAAKPANRLLAVNTEKHFDHIGGNSFFQSHGVEIWGHAKLCRTPEEFNAEVEEGRGTSAHSAIGPTLNIDNMLRHNFDGNNHGRSV